MKKGLPVIALLIVFRLTAQDTITLDYCYKQAEKNWPLVQQMDLLTTSNKLKIKNISKAYLPQMNFNGSATFAI